MRTAGANAEVTRGRIHRAAVDLFARKGFAATGIREIADGAGITSGALYGYMGTKEELLFAIMRSTIDPLTRHGERIVSGGDRAPERLVALVEQHVRFHCAHPRYTLITDSELRALTGPRPAPRKRTRPGPSRRKARVRSRRLLMRHDSQRSGVEAEAEAVEHAQPEIPGPPVPVRAIQ